MQILIHEQAGRRIAEVTADSAIVRTPNDALEILMNLSYEHQATKVLLHQKNIAPEFFDLKTRLAGEILQKVVNYRMQVAIVGDFSGVTSESLRAFIVECNRGRDVFFVESVEEAKKALFER